MSEEERELYRRIEGAGSLAGGVGRLVLGTSMVGNAGVRMVPGVDFCVLE
jgi:hypothetical protein